MLMSILAGGATGLLGTLLSSVTGYFERAQRHRQEMELRNLDLRIVEAESASAERVAALEAESHASAMEMRALEASHREANVRWSRGDSAWLVLVDVVRGLLRPGLTVAFLAIAAHMYYTLPAGPPVDVGARMVDMVLYLMSTTTLWWFGTRPKRQAS